jgi:hypothetical protein
MVGLKKKLRLWWEKVTNFNPYGIWPEGACPVQAEGYTKEGNWYYFRARGRYVTMVICESEEDYQGTMNHEKPYLFERELFYGMHDYQAGWMSREDAVRLATVWFNEYYEKQQVLKISKKTKKWLNKLEQKKQNS